MGFIKKIRDSLSLRDNIPPLLLSSFLDGTIWNINDLVWQPYVLVLGGDMTTVGLLQSLYAGLCSLFQFFTGEVVDSIGRKKSLIVYYFLCISGIIFSLMAGSWIYLIPVIIIYSVADALSTPAFNAIFSESVDKNKAGLAFSLLSLTWWLPGLYSQILGGYLGDLFGVWQVMAMTLGMELITLVIFVITVRETLKIPKQLELGNIIKNIKGLFHLEEHRDIYALAVVDRFGWALSMPLFISMVFENFGFSLLQIGVLMTATSLTTTVMVIFVGKIVDRYDYKYTLRVATIISALMFLGFSIAGDFQSLFILQVVKGLAIAVYDPSMNAFISNSVEQTERGKCFGNMNGLRGLISLPAPIIGSIVFSTFGFNKVFYLSLVVSIIAIVLTFKLNNTSK